MTSLAAQLARHLRPNSLVAIGDGVGAPLGLGDALAEAAASVGGVRLLLGWCLAPPAPLHEKAAFTDVRTIMGGYALRRALRAGLVRYVPSRLSAVPALLETRLRPDVVLTALAPSPDGGGVFGAEVGWLPAAVETGATVLAELNHALPAAAGGARPRGTVHVVAEVARPPIELPSPSLDEPARAIGAAIAALVPEGATLQLGPGWIGAAVADAIDRPVAIASGVLSDAVVDLDDRRLLVGAPRAAYLAGSSRLYCWADGRDVLARIEAIHDPRHRVACGPFLAVNTALQIDACGQVNVEAVDGDPVGGLGGHPDFAAAGARDRRGLSIVAVRTHQHGRSTLVDRLDAPVSTPRSDVDVVVTECGTADLRGRSDGERAEALGALWAQAAPRPMSAAGCRQ